MPINEVSRRYVDEEPEFYIPRHQWRLRADNVKQGSQEEYVDEDTSVYVQNDVETAALVGLQTYQFMLAQNVAPEQARMVLPQNTMTEWIWSGTLGAFLDMLVLRLDPHTQYESRIVAQKIAETVKELFPVSFNARVTQ